MISSICSEPMSSRSKAAYLRNAFLIALAVGAVAAFCLMLATLGLPASSFGTERAGLKLVALVFTLGLVAAGASFLVRAARACRTGTQTPYFYRPAFPCHCVRGYRHAPPDASGRMERHGLRTAMGSLPVLHSSVLPRTLCVADLGLAQGSADQPHANRRDCGTGGRGVGRDRVRASSSRRLHPLYRALVWRTHRSLRSRRGDSWTATSALVITRLQSTRSRVVTTRPTWPPPPHGPEALASSPVIHTKNSCAARSRARTVRPDQVHAVGGDPTERYHAGDAPADIRDNDTPDA